MEMYDEGARYLPGTVGKTHSFKFLDPSLNRELADTLKKHHIDHSIDENGVVHYSTDDDEVVENDVICSIRDKTFRSWQVLTCPSDWVARYRDYMNCHGIPFREELSNGEAWFLIPRKYRPHTWRLEGPLKKKRAQNHVGRHMASTLQRKRAKQT